jgi:sulfur carrier protein ThiS
VNIQVTISRTKETKNIELPNKSTAEKLLNKLEIKPDTVLILSGNKPIPIDAELENNQEISILQVSSGG